MVSSIGKSANAISLGLLFPQESNLPAQRMQKHVIDRFFFKVSYMKLNYIMEFYVASQKAILSSRNILWLNADFFWGATETIKIYDSLLKL